MSPAGPKIKPDIERFQQAINYFTQNRFEHIASALPEEILNTPVVLGMVPSQTGGKHTVANIKASVLLEYIQMSHSIFVRGHNMPFAVGSRQDYQTILAFDTEEQGESLKTLLSISHFEVYTLRQLLEAGLRGDAGFCLWNEKFLSIVEADRVNEYARASLPLYEKTETGNVMDKLSEVSEKHNLRPEEVARLNLLLAQQDWIEGQPLLGSAKFEGMKANLLLITPKQGMTQAEVMPLLQELGRAASEIKSPFLVIPIGGRPPVSQGGLPPR